MESIKQARHWGVDIGGSFAKIGYLSDTSFVLTNRVPTGSHSLPDLVLKEIISTILEVDKQPKSIGFGIAGMVSKSTKMVLTSANLPQWNKVNIQSISNKYLQTPIEIDNDCNAFAIGSLYSGNIPSEGLWLFITLGTGIGGTIIYNGEIIYGTDFAGEFGHTTVQADGKLCKCGSYGCWEQYAGSEALTNYYSKLTGIKITPAEIAQKADKQDINAIHAFEEYGKWMGVGLANLANIFSPDGFFFGGGIASAFEHFEKAAFQEYRNRCNHNWKTTVLTNTYTAGAYGAAVLAMNQ